MLSLRISPKTAFCALGNKDLRQKPSRHLLNMGYGAPAGRVYRQEQQANFDLIRHLNRLAAVEYPGDNALRARIKSYELAFRMQISVPDLFDLKDESAATLNAYGEGYGRQLLVARRLVERGIRFVQIYHGGGGAGSWNAHSDPKVNHERNCRETDGPIATLLKDLKQRGLLDETLVVWGTEFGRTAGSENANGRDHHPFGFSCWLAGGGIQGGMVHGATDELGILRRKVPTMSPIFTQPSFINSESIHDS